ncbi:MAG TPA: glutaredoxin family protein [Polyangiaceae bacterium]|nr:glutaredoxin family protein [Polyangiaceae bacterium]
MSDEMARGGGAGWRAKQGGRGAKGRAACRLAALVALAALAAAGCRRRDDDPSRPRAAALPALELRDETPDLLLTWVDAKGEFHTVQRPAEVPPEGRDAVRVVVTSRDDGSVSELLYVANLAQKSPDGSYPVQSMSRAEWEAVAARRRTAARSPLPGGGEKVAALTVVIYGASWCGPCHQAADHLKGRGVKVVSKDIEAEPGAAAEMRGKLERAGVRGGTIPVIDVMGRVLVGFNPRELDAAVAAAASRTVTL